MTWCLCPRGATFLKGITLTIACCLCSFLAGRLQALWTRQPESLSVALLLLQGPRSSSPSRCWPIRSEGLQQGRGDPEISPRSRQLTARDLQVAPEVHALLWLTRYRPLMPRRSQAALPDFGWSHGLGPNLEICNSPLLRRLPNVQHVGFIN